MSEYFLADVRAREREKQRERQRELEHNKKEPKQAQEVKITLLGDFLFPSNEPQGCDPYNSTNGRSAREAWKSWRDRR
jgi:hypothetical protein